MLISDVLAHRIRQLAGFSVVSAGGLVLDTLLLLFLVRLGLAATVANLVSASVAVTFVYALSTYHVFKYRGRFFLSLFGIYVLYQVIAVTVASLAVGALHRVGLALLVGKLLTLPFTFTANFVALKLITDRAKQLTKSIAAREEP